MYTGLAHTHKLVVTLFLLIYLIKTVLLLSGKEESLAKFTKKIKVPEMIISTLFLITGAIMLTKLPEWTTFFIIKLVAVLVAIPTAIVGFKKANKALAIFSLLCIFTAYGMGEAHKAKIKKGNPVVLDSSMDTMQKGKAIYLAKCVMCHGDDGQLGKGGAKNLQESVLTSDEKYNIIKNGKNLMAAYQNELSEEELKAVTAYVETLKK